MATQVDLGRSTAAVAREGAPLQAEPAIQAPVMYTTKLLDHSNVCYINATVQALVWLMEFGGACLGQLQAAVRILRSNRGVHLPDCMAVYEGFSVLGLLCINNTTQANSCITAWSMLGRRPG